MLNEYNTNAPRGKSHQSDVDTGLNEEVILEIIRHGIKRTKTIVVNSNAILRVTIPKYARKKPTRLMRRMCITVAPV